MFSFLFSSFFRVVSNNFHVIRNKLRSSDFDLKKGISMIECPLFTPTHWHLQRILFAKTSIYQGQSSSKSNRDGFWIGYNIFIIEDFGTGS